MLRSTHIRAYKNERKELFNICSFSYSKYFNGVQ